MERKGKAEIMMKKRDSEGRKENGSEIMWEQRFWVGMKYKGGR